VRFVFAFAEIEQIGTDYRIGKDTWRHWH